MKNANEQFEQLADEFHKATGYLAPGMPDRYFDHEYFNKNRDKYKLIQIEDTLSPVLLSEVLGVKERLK
jgi:hypothetical protein